VFGNHLPSALALDGPLVVSLGVMGLTFDNVEGFEDCGFEIVNESLQDGIKLVSSANPGFLARFLAEVTLPAGWSAEVVGNSVVATTSLVDRPQFSSSGEKLLSAADGWSGPALADGASVYVSGRDTVAVLDGSAPAISKITVKNGATLVLKELPQPMPELEARFDAKIVIPRGMDMELPPISAEANSSQIPVIEISTNATVRVADNYEFKNVHLDLFGKLQHGANVWFGTANPGETTYFGMRAIGATLDDYLGSSGTNSYVCPKAPGGRVIAPNGIYFKNVTYLPLYSKYTSCNVGNMNPVDEPFTMTLDGCYLDMRGNRLMTFGGAATILGVNGGGLYRHNAWSSWGLYGRFEFVDKARLVLEDGSYIYFMYNQRFLAGFNPQSAGYEQLVLRNGSFFAVHTPNGNDKAVVRVENSYCDVMQLQIDQHKKARPD
jgi:hypothetical protein